MRHSVCRRLRSFVLQSCNAPALVHIPSHVGWSRKRVRLQRSYEGLMLVTDRTPTANGRHSAIGLFFIPSLIARGDAGRASRSRH